MSAGPSVEMELSGEWGPVEDAVNPVGGSVYRLKWEGGGCGFLGGPRKVVRQCFRAVVND